MHRVRITFLGSLCFKRVIFASAFALAFLFAPPNTLAIEIGPGPGPGDFEILPGLAAEHSGSYVEEDVSFDQSETSAVVGDELTESTSEWLVHFLIPLADDVLADRAAFVLGEVDPDFALHIIGNYDISHAAIPGDDGDEATIESSSVSFPNLILKDPMNTSGTYGLFVYVYPETKLVENSSSLCQDWDYWDSVDYEGYDETCFSEEPYIEQDFLDWFQWNVLINPFEYEGEIPETYDPEYFRFLTFDYIASTGPVYQECCSSVVFLPGFQGSVLERGTDTLWPVTLGEVADDFRTLEMYPDGTPVFPDIIVDGIVETFPAGPFNVSVYEEFVPFMDSLVENNTIAAWKALPYDWRLSPEVILQSGVQTQAGTVNLLETIETLATDSDTGQVSIVGHSMGGLMAKAIVQELEAAGKAGIVDGVVMVGTPQFGTPQAATGLLHGEGAVLGQWPFIIADRAAVRSLARNMQSAHNLLPSEEYFNRVTDPVATFDPDTGFTDVWRNHWGLALGNFIEYFDFIIGNGPARTRPDTDDTQNPEVLNFDLVQNALTFHQSVDNYTFPPEVRVVQVAGWGLQTIKGLKYTEDDGQLDYEPQFTAEGDHTVVYPSAIIPDSSSSYFIHLLNHNNLNSNSIEHRNLLNSSPVQSILLEVFEEDIIAGLDFVSKNKPEVEEVEGALLVSAHSPVTLGVTDDQGRFTGIALGQNIDEDILFLQEDIPGSSYQRIGEGQYITVPKGSSYTFTFTGTGTGSADIRTASISGDTTNPTSQYSNIPITPSTIGALSVDATDTQNATVSLDEDGDGFTDQVIEPDSEEIGLRDLVNSLREKVGALDVNEKLKKRLLKRLDKIERKIDRQEARAIRVLERLEERISKKVDKGRISDVASLLALINDIEASGVAYMVDEGSVQMLRAEVDALDAREYFKRNLHKKIDRLEKKNNTIKVVTRLLKNITKKNERGRISDVDAQELIDLLKQLERSL